MNKSEILIVICIILAVGLIISLWFNFDGRAEKSTAMPNSDIINVLNNRLLLIEKFLVTEFPKEVAGFNDKINKGEIK